MTEMGRKPRRFGLAGMIVEILRRLRGLVFVFVEPANILGTARRSEEGAGASVLGSGVGSAVALLLALGVDVQPP